jgi:hypothetical protein
MWTLILNNWVYIVTAAIIHKTVTLWEQNAEEREYFTYLKDVFFTFKKYDFSFIIIYLLLGPKIFLLCPQVV